MAKCMRTPDHHNHNVGLLQHTGKKQKSHNWTECLYAVALQFNITMSIKTWIAKIRVEELKLPAQNPGLSESKH